MDSYEQFSIPKIHHRNYINIYKYAYISFLFMHDSNFEVNNSTCDIQYSDSGRNVEFMISIGTFMHVNNWYVWISIIERFDIDNYLWVYIIVLNVKLDFLTLVGILQRPCWYFIIIFYQVVAGGGKPHPLPPTSDIMWLWRRHCGAHHANCYYVGLISPSLSWYRWSQLV